VECPHPFRLYGSDWQQGQLCRVLTRNERQDRKHTPVQGNEEARLEAVMESNDRQDTSDQQDIRQVHREGASESGIKINIVISGEDFYNWQQYEYKNGKIGDLDGKNDIL
jgi:hypothetical protein